MKLTEKQTDTIIEFVLAVWGMEMGCAEDSRQASPELMRATHDVLVELGQIDPEFEFSIQEEFREYLYGMPEYEDMTDEQSTRVVEVAAFHYGGGIRTVKGAVERAVQDVQEWGL